MNLLILLLSKVPYLGNCRYLEECFAHAMRIQTRAHMWLSRHVTPCFCTFLFLTLAFFAKSSVCHQQKELVKFLNLMLLNYIVKPLDAFVMKMKFARIAPIINVSVHRESHRFYFLKHKAVRQKYTRT